MTLRVDELVLRELRIGLVRPFRTSRVVTTERRICLLEFRADGASQAWSECVAGELPDYTAETIDTAWHALERWLVPAVLGKTFATPRHVEDALRFVRGHRMAKAAVEMGFQAMAASGEGLALATFLGGTRDRVATGASLGLDDDAGRLAERARAATAEGYARIKVKIEPGREYGILSRVREAVGPDMPLAADANGAYQAADADRLRRLDALSLLFLEQPFEPDDWMAHARLQGCMRTPICLDESVESAAEVAAVSALEAGWMVNVKPGRVGGLGAAVRVHDACAAVGIPVFVGGMLETGLGRAYNRALAALPNFTVPGDLYPVSSYLETDIVRPAVSFQAGAFDVSSGPGIGVDVDVRRVDTLTVRTRRIV